MKKTFFGLLFVLISVNLLLLIFNNNYKNYITSSVVALYFNFKNNVYENLRFIENNYQIMLSYPKNKWLYYFNNDDKDLFKVEIVNINPVKLKKTDKQLHIDSEITLNNKFNSIKYLEYKQKQCKNFFVEKDIKVGNNKYKLFYCETKKRIFPVNIISENKTDFIINYWPFVKNDEMSIKQVKRFLKYIKFK